MNQHPFDPSTHSMTAGGITYTAGCTSTKVFAWFGIAFFLSCAFASYRAGRGESLPLFVCSSALCILIHLFTGTLTVDSERIIYKTPLGEKQIRWDEVKQVGL